MDTFNINDLIYYNGDNSFILALKAKYLENQNIAIHEFENEYLLQNFKNKEYKFKLTKIKISEPVKEFFKNEYNIDLKKDTIAVDTIIGETSKYYHLRGYIKGARYSFFYEKNDDNTDIYTAIYEHVKVDFKHLNNLIKANWELLPHQKIGVQFLIHIGRGLLLDDKGLGKTTQAVCASIAANCKKVLIVCLSGSKSNWRKEIENVSQSSKTIVGRKNWNHDPVKYTIINYDILTSHVDSMLAEKYDCIIVDECDWIKNPNAARAKALAKLTIKDSVKYVWGLTGTILQYNIQYYNVCRSLNIDVSDIVYTQKSYRFKEIYEKYEEFKFRYCNAFILYKQNKTPFAKIVVKSEIGATHLAKQYKNDKEGLKKLVSLYDKRKRITGKTYNWTSNFDREEKIYLKYKTYNSKHYVQLFSSKKILVDGKDANTVELGQRVKAIQIRRLKLEVLPDFVQKFRFPYYISLSTQQKKDYKNIYEEYIKASGKDITNENVKKSEKLVKTQILRKQLALWKVKHTIAFVNKKIEKGEHCIIFTHFKEELKMLAEAFKDKAVVMPSGSTDLKKQKILDKFENDANVKLIIGNIIPLGTGHNITKATTVIFNSPDWSDSGHSQGEDRSWRLGQNQDVYVYYIIFEDTVEEKVFDKAESKKENTNKFFGEE